MASKQRLVLGVIQENGKIHVQDKHEKIGENTLKRCGANEKGLHALDLCNMLFTHFFLAELGTCLRHNTQLHELHLDNCRLSDEGVRVIVQGLARNEQRTMKALSFEGNEIRCRGACHVAKLLDTKTTKWTRTVGGYRAPACQDVVGIRYLSLRNNSVAAHGAKAIAEVLISSDNSLETLDFEQNQIDDWGAGWLAMVLRNHNVLRRLNCRENPIGSDGVDELKSACASVGASLVFSEPKSVDEKGDENDSFTTVYVSEVNSESKDSEADKPPNGASDCVVQAFRRPSSASRRQALGTLQRRNPVADKSALCRSARSNSVKSARRNATRVNPWPTPALARTHSACSTSAASEEVSQLSKSSSLGGLEKCATTVGEAGIALAPASRWCRKPRMYDAAAEKRVLIAQGGGTKAIRGLRRSCSVPGSRKHGMILGPVASRGMVSCV